VQLHIVSLDDYCHATVMPSNSRQMTPMLLRTAPVLASITIILLGLLIRPLPIPLGALLIVIGATILIGSSETATEWVKTHRARNPRLHNLLWSAEKRPPGKLGDVIRRTSPQCLTPVAFRPLAGQLGFFAVEAS
jgi:hypothetical protein